jgi:hypothetical protein
VTLTNHPTYNVAFCNAISHLTLSLAPLRRPNKKQMMKLAKERVAKEAAQRKRYVTHYYY